MKCKVMKAFNDLKHDLETRMPGEIYEDSTIRLYELVRGGFVEIVEEEKNKEETKGEEA